MKPTGNLFATVQRLALVLLLLNGVAATIGGLLLMINPGGTLLQANVAILRYSPFSNFLLPGILLFIFNGISSMSIALLILRNAVRYGRWVTLQGIILLIWLIIEVYLLETFEPLHLLMGIIATGLVLCGTVLRYRTESKAAS